MTFRVTDLMLDPDLVSVKAVVSKKKPPCTKKTKCNKCTKCNSRTGASTCNDATPGDCTEGAYHEQNFAALQEALRAEIAKKNAA
jgi:hypothetical protein